MFTFETDASEDIITGKIEFKFEIQDQVYTGIYGVNRKPNFFSLTYENQTSEPIRMDYSATLSGQSQQIQSSFILIPSGFKCFINFRFNYRTLNDIESTLESTDDELINPCYVLGNSIFTAGDGLASGKLLIEAEKTNKYKLKEIEYILNDQSIELQFEIDNEDSKPVRLTMTNNYLYNDDGDDDMIELLQITVLPTDRYNVTINISPTDVTANYFKL